MFRRNSLFLSLTFLAAASLLAQSAPHTSCGNGDFEATLTTNDWSGIHGCIPSTGIPTFPATNIGLFPGPINNPNAHQTQVSAGIDPVVGISTVAPFGLTGVAGGSTRAVRIGNQVPGQGSSCSPAGGTEKLTKTFVVTQGIVKFWYAVVLQNPADHDPHEQPSFYVVVKDAAGNVVPGLVDLGNGSGELISSNNLFFQDKVVDDEIVRYRDWSCAQITLTPKFKIGDVVTVEFVTEDCAKGAHYGYAYVDNFCGNCVGDASGNLSFNRGTSTDCGKGKVCFDYTLPSAGGNTGQVVINLNVLQNGQVLHTLTSGPLNGGTSHCFTIDPGTIPGLSTTLSHFDFAATGLFTLGTSTTPKSEGIAPDGITAGVNNDYKVSCDEGCCPAPNLITNGNFELGNGGFNSAYAFDAGAYTAAAVTPGEYAVMNATQAAAVSSAWNATNHGSCAPSGKFLVVNGASGQTGSKLAWSQTVPVQPGKEYRFCANFRNLPQCAFDVKPKIEIRFTSVTGANLTSVINANATNACDWVQETRHLVIPAGVVLLTTEIWLDETGLGDGNDLAIDDISLQQMQTASNALVQLNIASSNLTATTYNLSATPQNGQPIGFAWELCELDNAGNCIFTVSNPSDWWTPGPNGFRGFNNGTFTAGSTTPGLFGVGKKYMIKYGVFDSCTAWTESRWYFQFVYGQSRVSVADRFDTLQ
jgi:hypothetical protein